MTRIKPCRHATDVDHLGTLFHAIFVSISSVGCLSFATPVVHLHPVQCIVQSKVSQHCKHSLLPRHPAAGLIKLNNEIEGGELSDNQSPWKVPASSPGTVFMFTGADSVLIAVCLEGFFYGLYSGIFVIYLQSPPNKSRTTNVVFYAVCLLYILSTATAVSDIVILVFELRISTLSLQPQVQADLQQVLFRLFIFQSTASGCCNFLAQCILIYRCWIVWGQNIRVVIIPSFLAIAFLATWLAKDGVVFVQGNPLTQITTWPIPVILTSFALSMAANFLATGLIVFRILKVFLEVKAASTSVDPTLGSTRGIKLQHIIFVLIESGFALFSTQLVRIVLVILLPGQSEAVFGLNLVVGIDQMFHGLLGIAPTIILVRVSMRLSFDDEESFMESAGNLFFNPPSDPNTSSMPLQETNEDISFNDPPSPSDLNTTLQRMGSSSSSMPPQERNEDISFNDPSSDPNILRRMGSGSSSSSSMQ